MCRGTWGTASPYNISKNWRKSRCHDYDIYLGIGMPSVREPRELDLARLKFVLGLDGRVDGRVDGARVRDRTDAVGTPRDVIDSAYSCWVL